MRIFVTGSADGLGRLAAQTLLKAGHEVVVHVRAKARLDAVKDLNAEVVIGDLADAAQTRDVAAQVNELGVMDSVIHNAGVYQSALVMPVNVIAPYLLTALMHRPKRLIYLSSGMHRGGHPKLDGIDWSGLKPTGSYSDSKLFISAFAAALARRWPDVLSNSVDPGWVPTKMGGSSAPDDLRLGHLTQEWLATSADAKALTSGGYWHHQQRMESHPSVNDEAFQQRLLEALATATGAALS